MDNRSTAIVRFHGSVYIQHEWPGSRPLMLPATHGGSPFTGVENVGPRYSVRLLECCPFVRILLADRCECARECVQRKRKVSAHVNLSKFRLFSRWTKRVKGDLVLPLFCRKPLTLAPNQRYFSPPFSIYARLNSWRI